MDAVELRPLSLGEILDRSFTMYRRHFSFFLTLAAIFEIPSLAFSLWQVQESLQPSFSFNQFISTILAYCISIFGFLMGNGGTVLAISEFYLGHTATIGEVLRRVFGRFWALLGAVFLCGFSVGFGLILLIVPGIYWACRLFVSIPAVIVDRKGPNDALSRSWELTKGFAGRAFLIILLYYVFEIAIAAATTAPLLYLISNDSENLERLRYLVSIQAVINACSTILVMPILQIATSIYYFDLRVRKEAFDIHFMMNPDVPADDPRFTTQS